MIEYKVLKELHNNPSVSQRTLAKKVNVSLGKINYILAGLAEKGIVKAKKLKNSPGKIRWQYILTPKGLKEKIKITRDFLRNRVDEFNKIQNEINELKKEVGKSYSN